MYSVDALRCQDPRDRIYALLAISCDGVTLGITPDYTISIEDVFHEVSVRIFSACNDLKQLQYVCWWNNNASPNRPSWTINTARPPVEMAYWTTEISGTSTHPRSTTMVQFSKDHRALIVRGRLVDAIQFGSPPNYTNGSVDLEIRDFKSARFYLLLLSSWARILFDDRPIHPNSVFALCRCLLPDPQWSPQPRNGRSRDQERIYLFLCTWRTLLRLEVTPHLHAFEKIGETQTVQDVIQVMHILEGMYDDRSGAFSDQEQVEKDGLAFYNSMLIVGRSFGKTSSGRVYSSMHGVVDGDVVVALEGSDDRLWKLRPVDCLRYKLVGDIYVDGCMQGELYRDHTPDDLDVSLQLA